MYIAFLVTFVTFLVEALLHYNVGKHGAIDLKHLEWPSGQEMWDIVKVLAIFSAINAYLIPFVSSRVTL